MKLNFVFAIDFKTGFSHRFSADINAIAKMYGKQIIKNNEAYMTVEKVVVDFVMKGARFRVKDQGHQQLSEFN